MEITIKSIPIYFEEFGTGIPLLMLHGWPTDHRHMLADMEPLFQNRSGWRRIYPDLPGMGRTPGADWITNQDQMLKIVIEFIQTVAPGQHFVLAGTSYGGYLARGLIHECSATIDGVSLLVPQVETDETKQHLPAHQVLVENPQFLSRLTPEENALRDFFVVQGPEMLESFRVFVQPALAIADKTFLDRLEKRFDFSFPIDRLATPFPAPTLVITGRQDSLCGYREAWALLENYPRGTFAVLDRAGHGLGIEQKELFHSLTNEWLNRVEEYTAQQTD